MDQNPEQPTNAPQPEQPTYTQPSPQTGFTQESQAATPAPATPVDQQPFAQAAAQEQPTQPYVGTQPTQQPTPSVPQKNPGLVFGVVGIVLSFILLAPIGLVLSIIGTVKSHKAQASAVVSIIGIVLNILALIGGIIVLLVTFSTYGKIQQRAQDTAVETHAQTVASEADKYFTEKGSYPASASELAAYAGPTSEYSIVANSPTSSSTIQYVVCGNDGGQILYLLPSDSSDKIVAVGNASKTTHC